MRCSWYTLFTRAYVMRLSTYCNQIDIYSNSKVTLNGRHIDTTSSNITDNYSVTFDTLNKMYIIRCRNVLVSQAFTNEQLPKYHEKTRLIDI